MHDDAPDQVRVRFEGARAGSGPLTFGQRNTLNWVRQETDEFSAVIHSVLDLPEGVTLADIGAAFAVLLARHESLRTSYTVDSDEPVQHVARAGELVIEVHRPADPVAAVSDVLVARLRAEGIDFTSGLPLRVAVAVHHDVPVVAVLVCSHMAVDFGSMAMVARQFTELAADPASRVLGEPGHQPLDQAAVEHSDRGRRSAEAALRYWETHLRSAPQSMYPVPPPAEPGDGLRRGFMLSPAGGLALGHITVRTRSSRQVVLLAAMCAVLSQRTGVRRCVFASVSGNRFRVRLREYVGALAQDGLLALDVEGPTFDDLVVRAARATLAANTNSMFDSSALWRIIDQVGHERGTAFTRDFSLNDLSTHLGTIDSTPGVVGDVSSVAAALAQTTVQWFDSVPYPVVLMCNPAQLEPALMFALTADTRYVGEAETESLLRGVEALLVAAASGTVSLDRLGEVAGVEPVHRGADWVCVDSCWVDLSAVSALVAEALPESTTHVVATNSPTGPGITAYLTATDDVRTPVQAHAACMATLIRPGRHTAMAPTHYSLHVSTPVDPAEDSAWQALPVLAEGDGRVKTS